MVPVETIETSLLRGESVNAVRCALRIGENVVRDISRRLEREGRLARCPCGKPPRHPGRCAGDVNVPMPATIESRAERRARIVERIGRGERLIDVATGLRVPLDFVRTVARELAAAGTAPTRCRCGRTWNHRGRCPSPRAHRGDLVRVPLTTEQRDELRDAATRNGLSLPAFLRWAALCEARR